MNVKQLSELVESMKTIIETQGAKIEALETRLDLASKIVKDLMNAKPSVSAAPARQTSTPSPDGSLVYPHHNGANQGWLCYYKDVGGRSASVRIRPLVEGDTRRWLTWEQINEQAVQPAAEQPKDEEAPPVPATESSVVAADCPF